MYGIFTNINPKNGPNVGKYYIHGAYWALPILDTLHFFCWLVDIPIVTKRLTDLKYPSKIDLVYRILNGFDWIWRDLL